jgi:hypothetical protein|tara:strand:+ start:496 stop:702 length:207 start_codon:yes stop_codon:yes gene_type:complete
VAGNCCFLGKNNLNIHSTLNKDIYFKFLGIGTGQQITYLKLLINPYVWLVYAIFWNHHQFMAGKGLRP